MSGARCLWLLLVASLALVACTSTGGTDCFDPAHGPASPSCSGFTVGLSCPVDLSPWYACTCTANASGQAWVCAPSGAAGGAGGASGAGGSGGGDAG